MKIITYELLSAVSINRKADSREGLLIVVWFDAANIMRSRSIQSLHEKVERIAELKQTKKRSNNMSVNADGAGWGEQRAAESSPDVPQSSCGLCWELWA